ncbi:GyrI-like domain-containing protein [Kribbella lupini]|uniref:AraC effector-binding domain-containing protein n=1 Tax=Kribbella lupini TaxID=291602 RepID=A0ABN2AKW8_9ACTN
MRTETRATTEQATAVRRATLDQGQPAGWFPRAFGEVADYLHRHGIAPYGYPFARCHRVADGRFEVEAGFPVAVPIDGNGTIEPSSLPRGQVLAVWHVGAHETVGTAYRAVDEWLRNESAASTGDPWEVYHDLPTGDPLRRRTEILQPITFAGA